MAGHLPTVGRAVGTDGKPMDFAYRSPFDYVSTEALEAEIKRRKVAAVPPRLADNDVTEVAQLCKGYIELLKKGKIHDAEMMEHYIFEAAMTAFYGPGVWEWVNKRLK